MKAPSVEEKLVVSTKRSRWLRCLLLPVRQGGAEEVPQCLNRSSPTRGSGQRSLGTIIGIFNCTLIFGNKALGIIIGKIVEMGEKGSYAHAAPRVEDPICLMYDVLGEDPITNVGFFILIFDLPAPTKTLFLRIKHLELGYSMISFASLRCRGSN